MRIAWDGANRSLRRLVGWYFGQTKGSDWWDQGGTNHPLVGGLIDNLQQATVPKQASQQVQPFWKKGKRGIGASIRVTGGGLQEEEGPARSTNYHLRNGVCGSPP